LKHGFWYEKALEDSLEQALRAEWTAIISECMERGMFAR